MPVSKAEASFLIKINAEYSSYTLEELSACSKIKMESSNHNLTNSITSSKITLTSLTLIKLTSTLNKTLWSPHRQFTAEKFGTSSISLKTLSTQQTCPLKDSTKSAPISKINMTVIFIYYKLDYDAFIILHGTDTLSYTASALSFMIENLKKTVIITGAQVPMG